MVQHKKKKKKNKKKNWKKKKKKKKKFCYSINMSNPQQNEIKNEIEQIKTEINLLQDKLKQSKKKIIAKWTKANCKNAN